MKLPSEILDDRVAIVGTSGSGKTVAGKLGVEALLEDGARVCIVDALGVWYGLRSNAAGTGPGFPITIFGGQHGDLPLTENAGEVIAEAVATGAFSCIVDLSELPSQAKRRRFMHKFAETLYAKNRDPLHLILDEADLWAPQKPLEDIAALLGARIDEIVRRGRARGFVPWLITQRPAVIHKDVLSQLDTLIAMKLVSSQDRNALGAWIEGQADKAEEKRILGALPALSVGEGFIWSPGHGMLKQVKFSMIRTFDSSRTPKRGERVKAPAHRASVDLDAIRAKLATVETEAAENDPKALRAEIARLKREAGQQPSGPTQADLDGAHRQGQREGFAAANAGISAAIVALTRIDRMLQEVHESVEDFKKACAELPVPGGNTSEPVAKINIGSSGPRVPVRNTRPMLDATSQRRAAVLDRIAATGPGTKLPKAETRILTALAQYPDGRTKTQVAILTGYASSGGGFNNALSSLRSAGRIEGAGDRLAITPQGIADLGPYDPLPHGDALLEHWRRQLGKAENAALDALTRAYPKALSKEQVAEIAGYEASGGGFNNALSRLRTLELIEGRGELRATDHLFG